MPCNLTCSQVPKIRGSDGFRGPLLCLSQCISFHHTSGLPGILSLFAVTVLKNYNCTALKKVSKAYFNGLFPMFASMFLKCALLFFFLGLIQRRLSLILFYHIPRSFCQRALLLWFDLH